jgi:hypothetical protein
MKAGVCEPLELSDCAERLSLGFSAFPDGCHSRVLGEAMRYAAFPGPGKQHTAIYCCGFPGGGEAGGGASAPSGAGCAAGD